METLFEIKNLTVQLNSDDKRLTLVDSVNLVINKKETFCIVGESGSGKSLTSLAIMGLLDSPPLETTDGEIIFNGEDLLKKTKQGMQKIRGNEISMIFQEPMTALDPMFTIEDQLMESLRFHQNLTKKEMRETAIQMLQKVRIPRPKQIMMEYPHQLSGGMRQRVMIAIALICNPKLLIADEPTTALDVTVQAQILELMNDLKELYNTSILLITHDLGVVAESCDRVAVMYAGQIVEQADVVSLFHSPKHPYTKGLLKSVTSLGDRTNELYSIEGTVPSPSNLSAGCRFVSRCKEAMPVCNDKSPDLINVNEQHTCRCWLYQERR